MPFWLGCEFTADFQRRKSALQICLWLCFCMGFPGKKHGMCYGPQSCSRRRSDKLDKVTEEVRRRAAKRSHGPSKASHPCTLTTAISAYISFYPLNAGGCLVSFFPLFFFLFKYFTSCTEKRATNSRGESLMARIQ